jgi:hypothetical protein
MAPMPLSAREAPAAPHWSPLAVLGVGCSADSTRTHTHSGPVSSVREVTDARLCAMQVRVFSSQHATVVVFVRMP